MLFIQCSEEELVLPLPRAVLSDIAMTTQQSRSSKEHCSFGSSGLRYVHLPLLCSDVVFVFRWTKDCLQDVCSDAVGFQSKEVGVFLRSTHGAWRFWGEAGPQRESTI